MVRETGARWTLHAKKHREHTTACMDYSRSDFILLIPPGICSLSSVPSSRLDVLRCWVGRTRLIASTHLTSILALLESFFLSSAACTMPVEGCTWTILGLDTCRPPKSKAGSDISEKNRLRGNDCQDPSGDISWEDHVVTRTEQMSVRDIFIIA